MAPGGNGFGATTESIERAISVASSTHQTISGQLRALQGNVNGEIGPWRGPTKDAFQHLSDAWFADGRQILTSLEQMITGLKTNLSGYQADQEKGQQHFTRVSGMLNR
jgi:uncharacterized protein YukE